MCDEPGCDGTWYPVKENNNDFSRRCKDYKKQMRFGKLKEKFPGVTGNIEEFNGDFENMKDMIEVAKDWLKTKSRYLFLVSPQFGVGKTHLALHLLLDAPGKFAVYPMTDFFLNLSKAAGMGEPDINFEKLKNQVKFLLLDDIKPEGRTAVNVSQFQTFLDTFPGKIIFTSNEHPDRWCFPSAIQSRLNHLSRVVIPMMNAKNMREKKK